MNSERKIFMAHFQLKPFTKHVRNRKTLTNLFKKITLGKVEVFKIIPIVSSLESEPCQRVGVYIYTAETSKDVKKVTDLLNKLNDDGVIDLDNAGHSGIYGSQEVEENTVRIR